MNLFEEYEEFAVNVRKLAPKTVSEYMRVLRDISKDIDLLGVEGADQVDQAIIKAGKKNGWDPIYEYKYSRILKTFYTWALYKRYVTVDLYPHSQIRKPRRKEPNFLTQKQFDFVYGASEESPVINDQDLTLFRVMWDSGMRRSETAAFNQDEIDFDSSGIMLPREKTKGKNKSRFCPFTPIGASLLKGQIDFVRGLGHEKGVFLNEDLERMSSQGIYLRIKKIAEVANRAAFSPHDLRHSLGIRVLENGGDIGFVAKLLGHESLSTTLHYTNLAKDNTKNMYDKYLVA